MDVIRRSLSALLAIILMTAFENTFAQTKPNAPRNQHEPASRGGAPFYFDKPITLDSLTKYVHRRSRLRFSFNSTKVKGSQLIDLKKGAYTIDQLLQQIRKNTSLYYAVRNGYVIFQDNPPKIKTATPAVAKTNPANSPKKKVITFNSKPVQQPAKEIQPKPTVKALYTDTTKSITDTTHKPDSVKVLLPPTPRAQTGINEDDDDANKNRGRLHLSFGRKPIDTTIIDTANLNSIIKKTIAGINSTIIDTPQKTGLVLTLKPATAPVEREKKERIKRSSIPVRIYDDVATPWTWQYGLQWKATIPLNGSKKYFTGTNTRSEPYNLLIPGIWLSTTVNYRHELMLLVKPAEWYFYDKNVYRRDTTRFIDNSDSVPKIITRRKAATIIKSGGWYGSLQYNYHLNESWMVGAGVGYHLRAGALANQQTFKNLTDSLVADSLYSMDKDTETDKYLASSFITGKVEVAWHFNAWDVGATILMPLTNAFADKSLNKSRPLNVQLFVRWRIKRDKDE
jgi:hypothetical protein